MIVFRNNTVALAFGDGIHAHIYGCRANNQKNVECPIRLALISILGLVFPVELVRVKIVLAIIFGQAAK